MIRTIGISCNGGWSTRWVGAVMSCELSVLSSEPKKIRRKVGKGGLMCGLRLFYRTRIGKARHPVRDLIARPAVIVVQVHDNHGQTELLCAALGRALPDGPFQTIENIIEILRRSGLARITRDSIHTVVSRAKRTRGVLT